MSTTLTFLGAADAGMLTDWLKQVPAPASAFVVHGEPTSAESLAHDLRTGLGWNAVVPRHLERVLVGR